MPTRIGRVALSGLVAALAYLEEADAHEVVGNRFFPATLTIDDPGVNDELALPTVSSFTNGDAAKELDIAGDYSKLITADFAVGFGETWTRLKPSWMAAVSGFQNLDTGLKYRLYKNPEHEFVMSIGLGVEWGRTGAAGVGAESFNVYTPAFFFGKGLGDLPDTMGWARRRGCGTKRRTRGATGRGNVRNGLGNVGSGCGGGAEAGLSGAGRSTDPAGSQRYSVRLQRRLPGRVAGGRQAVTRAFERPRYRQYPVRYRAQGRPGEQHQTLLRAVSHRGMGRGQGASYPRLLGEEPRGADPIPRRNAWGFARLDSLRDQIQGAAFLQADLGSGSPAGAPRQSPGDRMRLCSPHKRPRWQGHAARRR